MRSRAPSPASCRRPQPRSSSAGPLDTYKAYLEVLAKADSLDQLLPYYTSGLAGQLAKMPKEMQGNYVKMNPRVLKDVQVTKEPVTATKAEYQMTAIAGGKTHVRHGDARQGGGNLEDRRRSVGDVARRQMTARSPPPRPARRLRCGGSRDRMTCCLRRRNRGCRTLPQALSRIVGR